MFKLNFLLATIIVAIKVSSAAESEPPSEPSFLAATGAGAGYWLIFTYV